MNDRWVKADGSRWTDEGRTRVQRRFRHHLRGPRNPLGRIHREECCFTGGKHGSCWYLQKAHGDVVAEAHHLSYDAPFRVVWLCTTHHRRVERGTLKVPKRAIWDYTSLVDGVAKHGLRVDAPF